MSTTTAARHTAAASLRRGRLDQPAPLAGFRHQVRFMIRRDRIRAPVWIVSVVGLVAVSAASVIALYRTPADLEGYATIALADAAFKAITGPGYGLDEPTTGAVVMNETSLYTYVGVALMCIFMTIRHTRAEEDSDRAELVRAAPVGRHATLAAAWVWVSTIALVIGTGLVVVLVASGLPLAGSVAFGAATVAIGVVFVGVASVTAQVTSSGRAANSTAAAVLGASFMIRAVGDMGNGWMTWLSPLGTAQAIRPFADERWWVIVPLAALTAGLGTVAAVLLARRDLGAGLVGQRPGRAGAGATLTTPFALAVRLQRASMIGWTVGLATLGFFMGLVADQAEALADNEAVAEILRQAGQGSLTDAFLATIVLSLALLASGFTVSSVLRARIEELAMRADPLLATPVSRRQWLWSHAGVALVGSLVLMLAGGLTTGVGYAVGVGDAGQIVPVVGAALAMYAGLAVLAAFTLALVGVDATWSIGAWSAVALVVVVGFLAETLDLPQWIRDLSPFEHVPGMPAAPFDLVPILALGAVAAGLTVVGTVAIRRRDIG